MTSKTRLLSLLCAVVLTAAAAFAQNTNRTATMSWDMSPNAYPTAEFRVYEVSADGATLTLLATVTAVPPATEAPHSVTITIPPGRHIYTVSSVGDWGEEFALVPVVVAPNQPGPIKASIH